MTNLTSKDIVLFVDDDVSVLKSIKRGLRQEPFTVLITEKPKEALQIMARENVGVLVADLTMSGMGGLELLRLAYEKFPSIIRIVLTGSKEIPIALRNQTHGQGPIFNFIKKPWSLEDELIPTLRSALSVFRKDKDYQASMVEHSDQTQSIILKDKEIQRLRDLAELLHKNENQIFSFLTKDIKPFLGETVTFLNELPETEKFSPQIVELLKKGDKIYAVLEKLEKYIKDSHRTID